MTVASANQQPQELDPDLAALQQLPPASPLIKAPGLATLFSASRSKPPELPALPSAAITALCQEYAAYCREAATPLCEGQKTLAKKMCACHRHPWGPRRAAPHHSTLPAPRRCGLEALCARILYLLALRFNELSGCAATLRDVPQIAARLQETQQLLQQCVSQADRLEQLLPSEHGAL